jgi:hypothetical protein
MRLVIDDVEACVTLPDEGITFPAKADDGEIHTIEITARAQSRLLLPLLASTPVASGTKPRRFFEPQGVQVSATSEGRVGLSLFLTRESAIHLVLERAMVEALKARLDSIQFQTPTKQ